MVEILSGLGLGDAGGLIVLLDRNPVVERSTRNLPRVSALPAVGLNVFDVLRHPKLLITKAAVAALEERLGPRARTGQAEASE